MEPFSDTILDALVARGMQTIAVGKIEDIFCHRGISVADHTRNNPDGIAATEKWVRSGEGDFLFVNLVDTDMLYGHRNDVNGYADALEYFDSHMPAILSGMQPGDILMVTADHGCDPTTPGTDHTREYIPLVITGAPVRPGTDLGIRRSFADIGATVFEYLTGETWPVGESFLGSIRKEA